MHLLNGAVLNLHQIPVAISSHPAAWDVNTATLAHGVARTFDYLCNYPAPFEIQLQPPEVLTSKADDRPCKEITC